MGFIGCASGNAAQRWASSLWWYCHCIRESLEKGCLHFVVYSQKYKGRLLGLLQIWCPCNRPPVVTKAIGVCKIWTGCNRDNWSVENVHSGWNWPQPRCLMSRKTFFKPKKCLKKWQLPNFHVHRNTYQYTSICNGQLRFVTLSSARGPFIYTPLLKPVSDVSIYRLYFHPYYWLLPVCNRFNAQLKSRPPPLKKSLYNHCFDPWILPLPVCTAAPQM